MKVGDLVWAAGKIAEVRTVGYRGKVVVVDYCDGNIPNRIVFAAKDVIPLTKAESMEYRLGGKPERKPRVYVRTTSR